MDKTNVIQLVAVTITDDATRQKVEVESEPREVFCSVKNITRAEWTAAGQRGLKPAACVVVWASEYQGEEIVILDGRRYGVYRTYQPNPEEVELYLEKKGGV